ncbi:MAG: cytochrome c-type biogenesis protein [Halioglobus sp.]
MRRLRLALLIVWSALVAVSAQAVIETYEFSSPALEERYQSLSAELRCPKCQNQNIADSNAPIAQDLRKLLYEQLEKGSTDQEILDYMVARYGEFVRYRPSFDSATAALWLAPVILLLGGFGLLILTVRRRGDAVALDSLSASDKDQLRSLVDAAEKKA